jgi:hypothetical protein
MAKVVAVHRLQLNPGVDPAAFEQFVQADVFPGLDIVFTVDKMMSHGYTKINWLGCEHRLLRPDPQTDSSAAYLWMIVAAVDDSELTTDEGLRAVQQEAMDTAQEFFDTGGPPDTVASVKLKSFASWVSLATYIEAASRAFTA